LLQRKLGRNIIAPFPNRGCNKEIIEYPGRLHSTIENGVCIVASDAHYWPGPPTLMHRALIQFIKEMKPVEVIMNGDVTDLSRISRHPPPANWAHQPTVQEEIEACQERLGEIEQASGKARRRWTFGNHDQRFSRDLAYKAPEFAKVAGTDLKDHFPLWEACWAVWINEDVVIKHRYKGGDNAPFNNIVRSGKSMITSHLHAAEVRQFTNYAGTLYGVDTGMIADPGHPAFDYGESNPHNWRSAFCILTFFKGRLLVPELVLRWDEDHVQIRGSILEIK
jgi:hypothetical protein